MDVDMRLMEALGGHPVHHLQNTAPAQTGPDIRPEFVSAVSELTNLLRLTGQVSQGSENPSYPNEHLSQYHSDGPPTSQLATALQLGLNDHALLQSLRLDDDSLQEILGCSPSAAVSTQEGLENEDRTQNNSHLQGSESSGIGGNSHDEELAEMQRAIEELSQPATRANSSPPSTNGPGSFSEYSGTSPADRRDGLAGEDSQSVSPASYRSNSQVLDMSRAMDVQTPQFLARNGIGQVRNPAGSSLKAPQDDPYEDPAKVAERERIRGENRIRKKRWRESNQDRNKDNDLRCRVTKRGNKLWGLDDSEGKTAWVRHEFLRRRARREAKGVARAADGTGLNMGAGSSSVFQAAYDPSPPPMSTINTSPIFRNFQTPFSANHAEETRVALQDLVSLLRSPNTTPQNLEAIKPRGAQTAFCGDGQGHPGSGLHSQQLGSHQPVGVPNTAPDSSNDRNNGTASELEEVAWPAPEGSPLAYYHASHIKDTVAGLHLRFNAPPDAVAGGQLPKPLESPIPRWSGPSRDENGFFQIVEVKVEPSEAPPEALQPIEQFRGQILAQQSENVALVTLKQGVESAIEKLSDADIDALFPTNADGEPDLNDEALGRPVSESGLCMDELSSGAVGPGAPAVSGSSRSCMARTEHTGIGNLVGGDSEESISIEQINALIGDLKESMGLDEPANTSSPHSRQSFSRDQVAGPTQDTIAALTSNWCNHQYPSTPPTDMASRGTKRPSPDDSSPLSKRTCKPPPKNPTALTQQLQVIFQSPDRGQPVSCHQVNSSYATSFGNSENMNKRLMKPPPYHPASKPPSIGITTGPGSAVASHAKSNEHEKKIKSMGFPPLMAGMGPR